MSYRLYPIAITDHARMRMQERMKINDFAKMDELAKEAYCFGRSKRQLEKHRQFWWMKLNEGTITALS